MRIIQAGLLAGAMAVTFSVSHASLITSSGAPQATPVLVAMALTGTTVLCLVLGLLSGFRGLITLTQDVPAAATGAIVLSIMQGTVGQNADLSVATVAALTVSTTFAFGISFLLFGMLRVGGLMRFAPRPMIAGFLAGTGWFVVMGALGICAGFSVSPGNVPALLTGPLLAKTLTAVGVALALVAGSKLLPRTVVLPVVLVASIVTVHLVGAINAGAGDAMRATNWFVSLSGQTRPWPPLPLSELREVDFSFLIGQAFPIVTMVVLATVALLMNASALELETRTDIRLDRELRVLGIGNLLAGLACGTPGYHGVSATLAARQLSRPHVAVSLITSATVFAALVFGNSVLGAFPLPVLAGFMLWVGGGLLREWLFGSFRVVPIGEAILLVAIFSIIVFVGLFEGTVFGLLAGALLFVVDYSRMNPVRSQFFADSYHGSSELPPKQLELLRVHGKAIAVIKVQGYIFFATAHKLREHVRRVLREEPDVKYLLLDLEAATGLDSTAVLSFHRIEQDLEDHGVRAVLTGMSPQIETVFRRSGVDFANQDVFQLHETLDSGLLMLETVVLKSVGVDLMIREPVPVKTILADLLGETAPSERLLTNLKARDLDVDAILCEAGDSADGIYFLESGGLEILSGPAEDRKQLRLLAPGAVVGEIAYLLDSPRSATVAAAEPSRVWHLSNETIRSLVQDDPELSTALHAGLARALAIRVEANTRVIDTLRA